MRSFRWLWKRKERGDELEAKEAQVSVSARLEWCFRFSIMHVRGVAELKAIHFDQGEIAVRALLSLLYFSLHALLALPCFSSLCPSLPPIFPSTYGILLVLINEVFLKYVSLKVLSCHSYSQSRAHSGKHLNLYLYTSYFAFEFYICHKKYFLF